MVRTADGTLHELGAGELDRISELRSQGALVWLDLGDPSEEQIGLLEREFGAHPLAAEDMRKRRQRPKVDSYANQYLIVAYEVVLPDAESEATADGADGADDADDRPGPDAARSVPNLRELHLVAGDGYLVTLHWGASAAIDSTRVHFATRPSSVDMTVAMLLYSVLDAVVDGYFPLLDRLNDRIEEIEEAVLVSSAQTTVRDVLAAKRKLLELRRVLAPMRDVANSLLRRDVELIEDAAVPYYQDLYDHLIRVLDALDLYRDLVASTLDASLSVTSNNLAAVMKRLTAYTVIIAVPTLIASIYGMNFNYIPELRWLYGYPAALLGMVVAVLLLWRYFRSHDWF